MFVGVCRDGVREVVDRAHLVALHVARADRVHGVVHLQLVGLATRVPEGRTRRTTRFGRQRAFGRDDHVRRVAYGIDRGFRRQDRSVAVPQYRRVRGSVDLVPQLVERHQPHVARGAGDPLGEIPEERSDPGGVIASAEPVHVPRGQLSPERVGVGHASVPAGVVHAPGNGDRAAWRDRTRRRCGHDLPQDGVTARRDE